MVLAKTDARISAEYDRRLVPASLQPLGLALHDRLARATATVLRVTNHREPVESTPVAVDRSTCGTRRVDPINLVQIELLARLRQGHPGFDPRVRRHRQRHCCGPEEYRLIVGRRSGRPQDPSGTLRVMKHLLIMMAALTLPGWSSADAADRLTDRDVKALVARIEQGRDRFDDTLDGDLKDDIVRGPSGEVKVDDFLNDFQENIDRLEERLKPDYGERRSGDASASGDGDRSVLSHAADGHPRRERVEPPCRDLKTLALAYGADFPLAEGAPVRRIGDRELADTAKGIAETANRLKKRSTTI